MTTRAYHSDVASLTARPSVVPLQHPTKHPNAAVVKLTRIVRGVPLSTDWNFKNINPSDPDFWVNVLHTLEDADNTLECHEFPTALNDSAIIASTVTGESIILSLVRVGHVDTLFGSN